MRLLLTLDFAFLGAVLFATPSLTRPEILFAVPVSQGFRKRPQARAAIRNYRLAVAIAMGFCVAGLLLAPQASLGLAASAGPPAILIAATCSFYLQNRNLSRFAVQLTRAREVVLSDDAESLPGWVWLSAVPFLILIAAACYLYLNWSAIPASFPVHWGADGQPNRWLTRTPRGVYGPVIFASLLCFYMLVTAFATWYGSRRSGFRRTMLGGLIACEFMLAILFGLIAINSLIHLPVPVIVAVPILFVVPLIVVLVRSVINDLEEPEVTPNECWKMGLIYYNPNDAALVVTRRVGIGYTFNFAHPAAWVLLLGLIPVVTSAAYLL